MSDQSRDSSPDSARSGSGSRASSPGARSQSGSPPRRSRSRSYSSSLSSSPKFVSATDSEAEKKSDVSSPRRRKVKTKKSPKQSSGNDSDSDAEQPSRASRPSRAAKKPTTATPKKKKKPASEAEDGEVSSSADSEVFDDGMDEDLIRDEDDRSRLENMTEFEREKELLKRAETREENKKRFEIEKKLKKQSKLRAKESGGSPVAASIDHGDGDDRDGSHGDDDEIDYNNVMDTKERSQNRQKTIESKKFDQKSSALSELKERRREKERKDAERQKKESERDGDDRKSKKRSSQRSSSSSSSGGSDRNRRRSTSSSSRSSSGSGSGSDTERVRKSPSKVQKYIESQEDLETIRLSRYKIEKFIHLPFFKTLAMNCYVRIGIGQHQGRSVYRAAEIVDVVETAKVYTVGNNKTNLGLRLRFGKEERVFRVEFISNQHIAPTEFEKWKEACQKADLPLPTIEFVKSKVQAIKKANNYNFTSDDIEKMVEQKEKFASNPKNYAMAKARWMKEKAIAIDNGDEERGKQMEQKLHDLEERAEELDKKRTNTISSVAMINDRNRKANVDRAYEAIRVEMEIKKREGEVANPFKRQKCNPRIPNVVKAKSEAKLTNEGPAEKENLLKVQCMDITFNRKSENDEDSKKNNTVNAENNSSNNLNDEPNRKKTKNKFSSGLPSSMQKQDLFDAHDFDIDIDVDIGGALGGTSISANAAGGASSASGVGSMTAASVAPSLNLKTTSSLGTVTGSGSSNKRSFNMKDYKEKRGLQ